MKSIPTMYHGIEYRSRLEARWAAFFDVIGWQHTYEPFDVDGYIPDFLIHGLSPLLVEVKPAVTLSDYQAPIEKLKQGLFGHWSHDVLILGADPLPRLEFTSDYDGFPVAGYLGENMANIPEWPAEWDFDIGNWALCAHCGGFAVWHEMQSWRCRPCGHYTGNESRNEINERSIESAWSTAYTVTKWTPAR